MAYPNSNFPEYSLDAAGLPGGLDEYTVYL